MVIDYLNFINMLAVLYFCIIIPLKTDTFTIASRVTMAASFVLIVFYPIILAGHYRLFSSKGRLVYEEQGKDYPWLTDWEIFFITVALLCAAIAGWYVAR